MKFWLRTEELILFVSSILLFNLTNFPWWYFPAFLLLPDIGMLGYVLGNKIGALTYNLFHHRGIAIIIAVSGIFLLSDPLYLTGLIMFAHIAMDRMLGYGLKYPDSFHNTHLGPIGKQAQEL